MDITLSRRLAKVMTSYFMLQKSTKERADFVREVEKYDSFESLPADLKTKIKKAEVS